MHELAEYFRRREFTESALDRYLEFAKPRDWDIEGQDGKLQLYEWASQAFDPSDPEKFRQVYDVVRNWRGAQRAGGGSWARAEKVFDAILEKGGEFLYGGQVSLTNLKVGSLEAGGLGGFLPHLRFVKKNKHYPWMPVSKVLHFANPGLFPIWDRKVMWETVMTRAFHTDYKTFCGKHGFAGWEDSAQFNVNYTLWAAHCIQQSDGDFMEWFREWMESKFADDLAGLRIRQRLQTFYATAFEFVAIGAACLEQP